MPFVFRIAFRVLRLLTLSHKPVVFGERARGAEITLSVLLYLYLVEPFVSRVTGLAIYLTDLFKWRLLEAVELHQAPGGLLESQLALQL